MFRRVILYKIISWVLLSPTYAMAEHRPETPCNYRAHMILSIHDDF